jgi:NO-binding membrane sensor protein with MHYT domain
MTRVHLGLGSVLMGAAIATMHYTGMAAMRLRAMHYYDHPLWTLSIVLAVITSFAGLLIIFDSGGEKRTWKHKLGATFALGIAIPLTHYLGMVAVHFTPSAMPQDFSHALSLSGEASWSIFGMGLLVLGLALFTSLVDRRLST